MTEVPLSRIDEWGSGDLIRPKKIPQILPSAHLCHLKVFRLIMNCFHDCHGLLEKREDNVSGLVSLPCYLLQ